MVGRGCRTLSVGSEAPMSLLYRSNPDPIDVVEVGWNLDVVVVVEVGPKYLPPIVVVVVAK